MGKIFLREMNDRKVEKIEPNDLKTSNDMRELEFRGSLYESLNELEYEYVLINGKVKYGGEWLSKIGNSKNGDEVLGRSVEVYKRTGDGYTRVFEIEPKEVLQRTVASPDLTTKHQAIERDVEER